MGTVKLVVTRKSLKYLEHAAGDQRQIAIREPSPEIASVLATAGRRNLRDLLLADCLTLRVGDTAAIWAKHNDGAQEDFDAIYGILARRPGQEMTLLCRLAPTSSP